MAEQIPIPTTARTKGGKHSNRRLRYSGQTPAVLYGHGEANVCLSVPSERSPRPSATAAAWSV